MSRFLGGVVLPLLLMLIPAVILRQGSRWERQQLLRQQETQLRDTAAAAGGKLQQAIRAAYWVEGSARRLVKVVDQRLSTTTRHPTARELGEAISDSLAEAYAAGVPEPRLWAITVPAASAEAELCESEGLESFSARLMTRLLSEMAHDASGEGSELTTTLWKQRLEQLFGYGCAEHFLERYRGRAFAVVFQGQGGMACWDFLSVGGRRVGFFLAISPLQDDRSTLLASLVLSRWPEIAGTGAPLPILIPLPTVAAPAPAPLLHPALVGDETAVALIRRVQSRLSLAPGIPWRDDYIRGLIRTGAKTPRQAGEHFLGRIGLPVDLIREELSLPNEPYSGVLLPPVSRAGWLVLMVNRKPQVPVGFLTFLADLAWLWWLLAVLVALSQQALGNLPVLSVRASPLLWLLGLGAIPLSHSVVVLAQWRIDEQQLLLANLREQLFRRLGQIESRFLTFQQTRQQACREFFRQGVGGGGLGERLRQVQFQGAEARHVQKDIWEHFRDLGLPLTALLILGHDDYILRLFEPGLPPGVGTSLEIIVRGAMTNELHKQRPASLPAVRQGHHAPFIMDRLSRNSDYGRQQLGQFVNWGAGSRRAQGYADWIKIGDECWYILYALWSSDTLVHGFLTSPHEAAERRGPYWILARSGNSWVARPGDDVPEPLLARAQQLGERAGLIATEHEDRLCAFHSSQSLPGYLLVTWAETTSIHVRIRRELLISLTVWTALALCIALGVSRVAIWLTEPVLEMTESLKRVAGNDLSCHLDASYGGEFGDTAKSLNTMVGWLRERRNMSRFVSSEVLEAVRERSSGEPAPVSRRRVAMLVSDIRAFTEMSERFPPQQVFDLLNEHLKRMTSIIQHRGGMIDRCIGDAIQAVFPAATPEEALAAATAAAIDMRRSQREYHLERLRAGLFGYETGIGIATGEVMAGIVGDRDSRLDFSLVGQPLLQAALLESQSKAGRDSRIIVSVQDAERLSADLTTLPLDGFADARELRLPSPTVESTRESHAEKALEQESRSVTAPGEERLKATWRWRVVSLLLLWVFFPLLVLGFHTWSRYRQRQVAMDDWNRMLSRDQQRVRVMAGSRSLEEWWLWRRLAQPTNALPGTASSTTNTELCLRHLQQELPDISWYLGNGDRVVASHGAPVGLTAERMDALMRALHDDLYLSGGSNGEDQNRAGNGIGLESFLRRDRGAQMCGRLLQVQTPIGPRWLFWRPLRRDGEAWAPRSAVPFVPDRKGRERLGERSHYLGDVVLLLTERTLAEVKRHRRRT
ncbi:MAG TPA: adenylate/guanylate cyclase domain-containing protein, partial [Candidatus Ozemobacteraceae bacterium]|nr:adenylate/guanylate cyclase domain-containing protein [Candidatus Ozemobacteraceae bacterium]